MNVKIYTTPTCGFCQMAKAFFKEHGIDYTEFDVSVDEEKRNELIEKSGQMGVPVIYVGEEMVVGFNESKLRELLNIK